MPDATGVTLLTAAKIRSTKVKNPDNYECNPECAPLLCSDAHIAIKFCFATALATGSEVGCLFFYVTHR